MRAEVGINVMTTNATFGGGEEKGLVRMPVVATAGRKRLLPRNLADGGKITCTKGNKRIGR